MFSIFNNVDLFAIYLDTVVCTVLSEHNALFIVLRADELSFIENASLVLPIPIYLVLHYFTVHVHRLSKASIYLLQTSKFQVNAFK